MSEDMDHGATTIRASKGGGGLKWWLGAGAAAIVLLGGGYLAWKYLPSGQSNAEIAAIDPYDAGPELGAGSLDSSEDAATAGAATAESDAASEPARAAPRSSARAAAVPEETIGVTPDDVTTEEVATEDRDDIVVTAPRRPIWASTPNPRRLSRYYPERALARGRDGEARLACTVLAGGALECEKIQETPGGFGNAALRVSRRFRHAPTLADGSDATGTHVNLRVVFRVDGDERGGRRYAAN